MVDDGLSWWLVSRSLWIWIGGRLSDWDLRIRQGNSDSSLRVLVLIRLPRLVKALVSRLERSMIGCTSLRKCLRGYVRLWIRYLARVQGLNSLT